MQYIQPEIAISPILSSCLIQSNFMAEKPLPGSLKRQEYSISFEFIFHKDSIFQRFPFGISFGNIFA